MKKKWSIISVLVAILLLPALTLKAQTDSTAVIIPHDSISNPSDSTARHKHRYYASNYEERVKRYHRRWDALIPTQLVVQNAGNMGVVSAGIGWSYGRRRQWETQLLVGYIPKYQSDRAKVSTTLKQNFLPWSLTLKRGWSIQPLSTSLYFNTVYGHEFWRSQPARYPSGYYDYMSTKYRINIALGQRATYDIPDGRRKFLKSVSFFYELSSCDLYIRSMIVDSAIGLKDIVGLSLGVKLQWM